jgi:hypothetical protein
MLPPTDELTDAVVAEIDASGEIALQDLYVAVADRLGLSAADRAERAGNGMFAYQDRISWVLTRLIQEGTVRRPDRAMYSLSDGTRINLADLTDRNAVDDAIAEFDQIGRDAFLEIYGFGEAREYYLVTEDGRYDSKAIFGVAWRNQHGAALAPDDFSGGKSGAAGRLTELGYEIEGIDTTTGRTSFPTFAEALADFPLPLENMPQIHDFLATRDYQEFYIPPSRPYIGMVPRGGGKADFLHYGYIGYRDTNGRRIWIDLPVNKLRDGGGTRQTRREAAVKYCPTCGLAMPASGQCSYC